MKPHFDIEKIVDAGIISNELDYERALIADRKLRLLASENQENNSRQCPKRHKIANSRNIAENCR